MPWHRIGRETWKNPFGESGIGRDHLGHRLWLESHVRINLVSGYACGLQGVSPKPDELPADLGARAVEVRRRMSGAVSLVGQGAISHRSASIEIVRDPGFRSRNNAGEQFGFSGGAECCNTASYFRTDQRGARGHHLFDGGAVEAKLGKYLDRFRRPIEP